MPPPDVQEPTFRRSRPGRRFQNRYWRHRAGRNQRSMFIRIASLLLAVVLTVLGLAMLVLPGPGIVCLAMAGALYASESLRIARALDGLELRARIEWRRRQNRRAPHASAPK